MHFFAHRLNFWTTYSWFFTLLHPLHVSVKDKTMGDDNYEKTDMIGLEKTAYVTTNIKKQSWTHTEYAYVEFSATKPKVPSLCSQSSSMYMYVLALLF